MNKYLWCFSLCTAALIGCGQKDQPKAANVVGAASASAAPASAEEKVLNIYHWPDYIAKDMLANFEKESGIKVNFQTFENNEALQAKLVAGNSNWFGYQADRGSIGQPDIAQKRW